MKRLTFLVSFVIALTTVAPSFAQSEPRPAPEPKPIELSGRLRRPIKWPPQLEIVPAGQIQRIDLEGNLIRDIKEGTPLRVRGVVRTHLHRGGSEQNPSPVPPQWIISLEVTEVEVLKDVSDVLK